MANRNTLTETNRATLLGTLIGTQIGTLTGMLTGTTLTVHTHGSNYFLQFYSNV